MWKFKWWKGRDKWLILLAAGIALCLLAFPAGKEGASRQKGQGGADGSVGIAGIVGGTGGAALGTPAPGEAGQELDSGVESGSFFSAAQEDSYERQLERRLEELLSHVEGVGAVEVMIVLESSGERIWRVDENRSVSSTKETDSSGGSRDVQSQELEETTILTGQGQEEAPLLEKELSPVIGGVIVSARGGGSPAVRTEITEAVEALLSVPAHKIKVLKMAE